MSKQLPIKSLMLCLVMLFTTFLVSGQSTYDKSVFRVKFEESSESSLRGMNARLNAKGVIQTGLNKVDLMNEKHQVVKMNRVFPYAGKFEEKHRRYGLHLWYEIEIKGGASIENAREDFLALGEISTTEFIHAKNSRVAEVSAFKPQLATLPDGVDDPYYGDQWHYENTGQTGGVEDADIDLDNAWLVETGSTDVIVSVHDEGIDVDHEDLIGNMWINTGEIAGNGIDDDNNGFIDDVHGYNFAQVQGEITAGNHGTHVAGTVAAESNNGIGGSGVAGGTGTDDGVRLMSCQVFSGTGSRGFSSSYVYAADNGSVISQNSWGYTVPGSYEQSVLDAIRYFIAEAGYDENGNKVGPMAGGIVIFAAGNDADNDQYFPGYMEEVIAVAGTNHTDYKFYASNFGPWVDIAAPGEDIFSSLINDGYTGTYSGTSMACPHVSGVAALIVSKFKDEGITPDIVRSRLLNTTDPLSFDGSENWGTGRVNAYKALADDDGAGPETIADLLITEITDLSFSFTWTAPNDLPDFTQVTTYDLRYSTSPIDASNFGDATPVEIKKPSAPGAVEDVMVGGLLPATTYYFAVTAADYFGNESELSNVVSGTTEVAPTIATTGDPSVSIDLSSETKTATGTFIIQNIGGNPLIYDILPVYGGIVENEVETTLLYPGVAESASIPHLQFTGTQQAFQNQLISSGGSVGAQLNFQNESKDELAYDDGNDEVYGSLKVTSVGDEYINWIAATAFEVPAMEDHFILSQVTTYMQVSYEAADLETRMMIIKGGETPLQGEVKLSQDIDNKEGSKFIDIPLEIPVAFESGDKFWVVFLFPEEPVEFGYDQVEGGHRPNTHMAYMNNQWTDIQTFSGYEDYVWTVRAIEKTVDGLSLDINHGILDPMGSQNIEVTYDATDVVRNADYDFDLYIVSNDPVNPLTIVDAKATIVGLLEPEMAVTPESITTSIDASVSTTATETITITNNGDGDLVFDFENEVEVPKVSIAAVSTYSQTLDVPVSAGIAPRVSSTMSSDIPVATYSEGALAYGHQIHPDEFFVTFSTDNPGTYVSQGGNLGYNVIAADFLRGDETNMYLINDEAEILMKMNLETEERTIIGSTLPFNDITTDKFENVVYGTDFNGYTSELYTLDVATGEATLVGSMGDGIMVAIACDGDGDMWGFKLNDGNIYSIDKTTGASIAVGHVGFTGNYNQSMSWDPKSDIIYMAAYNYIEERGELRVVDTTTGATELVGVFPNNAQVSALTFPGGGYHDFTSVSPTSGTIAPSASMDIEVFIDATQLPNGNYYTPITISSNDYDDLTHVVPVALEVVGQIGEISVDTQIKDFGSVLLGADKDIQLRIENTGIGALDIESITSSEGQFTTDLDELETIDMGGALVVTINFTPIATGQFNSVLTINSNDPKNPETKITMTGSAILPPEIVIEPDTVELTLNSGEIATRNFVIKNEGAYPLQYAMTEYEANASGEDNSGVDLSGLGGPDEAGYRWIDSNDSNGPVFVWNDIADEANEILPGKGFGSELVDLPFEFPFYGEMKTSMYISVEGFVTFASAGSTTNFNRQIPSTYTPNDIIAGYWDNLRWPNTYGNQYYAEFDDKVIMQWEQVGNNNTVGETFSFQIVMFDDGRIMFYYDDVNISVKNSGTIGVENADGSLGVGVSYNESYIEDELAVLIFPGYKGFDNVTVDTTNGIIAPGEEETIEVTIDASGLLEGSYSNEIYLYNNDPYTPKAQFTAVLNVIGHPEIILNKENLSFTPIIAGTQVSQSFTIQNTGSKEMNVTDIVSSDASFTTSFVEAFTLAAGEKMSFEVNFAPETIGEFSGNITITSDDDFGNSTLALPVSGSAIVSPEISVTAEIDPFELTLNSGENGAVSVSVENLSGSTLNYIVHAPSFSSIDGVDAPEVVQGTDEFGYTWADSDTSDDVVYDWIDIAESGNRLPLATREGTFVSLPFMFPFYDNAYDEVQVAANGFLTFNTALGSSGGYINREMPSTTDPDNQIAILWDDLSLDTVGDIYYLVTPDYLIVQYSDIQKRNEDYTGTFQAILYANGDIKLQYKDLDDYTQINSVSVGIENEDGTDGFSVVYNQLEYLKSEMAIYITSPFYKGSLEVGESESFDVLFDTETIYEGVYTEPIKVVSNDAASQITQISATLTVTGVQQIGLSTEEMEYDTLHYISGEDVNQIQEFKIYNNGTKSLNVGPLSFSEATTDFQFDKTMTYDIAPKDSLTVKVMFLPGGPGQFVNTLNIPSDDATRPVMSIALEGVALLPPQAVVSTLETLTLELLSTETAVDITTLSNEGSSDLSYSTDIRYFPYGLPGTVGESDAWSAEDMTSVSFGDTIFYDQTAAPDGYYGQNGITTSKVAVKFTLEDPEFYLTHVSNFYNNNGAYEPSLLQVYKGGTRPENGEFLTGQQFAHSEAEAEEGYEAIIELEEPQLFYEDEHFWVVITYPESMTYPAAYNDRPTQDPRASWYFPGHAWINDASHNFKIRALEETGGYGDWLTINPSAGELEADASVEMSFDIDASKAEKGGSHYAMVTYNFNDPETPSAQRVVELYVNQIPEIDVLENINVQEGTEVNFTATATDLDGSILDFTLADDYAFTSMAVSGDVATITCSPDFQQAGVHIIELLATDDMGETASVLVTINVANVNRAPKATAPETTVLYVGEEAMLMDGYEIFTDADADELTFRALIGDEDIVRVDVTSEGFEITGLEMGESEIALFASDGTVEVLTTLAVTVLENHAPIAVSLESLTRYIHDGVYSVLASDIFSDEDTDNTLTYSVSVADESIATATVTETGFEIMPKADGKTAVTLSATDGIDEVSVTFNITVIENHAPVATTVDDMEKRLDAGSFIIVAEDVFSDANSDALAFSATVSDESIVSVNATSTVFEVTPLAGGEATITLSATDGFEEVSTSFSIVIVENGAPLASAVEDVTLIANGEKMTIDISDVFTDAEGDDLFFNASSDDASIVAVSVSSGMFIIEPLEAGTVMVTLGATDVTHDEVTVSFNVTVEEESLVTAVEVQDVEIGIYPNPIQDYVNVKWDKAQNFKVIRLINNAGTIVYTVDIPSGSANVYRMDLAGMRKGLYHLQLISNDGVHTEKVIKK